MPNLGSTAHTDEYSATKSQILTGGLTRARSDRSGQPPLRFRQRRRGANFDATASGMCGGAMRGLAPPRASVNPGRSRLLGLGERSYELMAAILRAVAKHARTGWGGSPSRPVRILGCPQVLQNLGAAQNQ
jgi:hypothetical protein